MARLTVFKEEYVEQAYRLCLLGATDVEMADFFGVSEQTFNSWKKKQPELLESIKRGKEDADARVAQSLFRRATGYEREEIELKVVSLGGREGSVVEQVPVIKHYPPETAACAFWLKNRQKAKWRDKHEIEISLEEGLAERAQRARERADAAK